ncbi:MAG: DUF6263 family protein, partial [Phycisphaerales bacterium]
MKSNLCILTASAMLMLPVMASAQVQPTNPPTSQPTMPENTMVQEAATVRLLEAGAMPHQEIRFDLEVGTKQRMEMVNVTAMSMMMNGQTMPMPPMNMKMVMEAEVLEVMDNGDFKVHFKTVEASMEGMPGMDAGMDAFKDMEVTTIMDSRGVAKDTDVNVNDPAMQAQIANFEQTMGQMSAPFPVEPVGVGGKWEVTQKIEVNGMKIKQTAVYELVSLNGHVAEMKVTITQSADAQNFSPPGVPAGTTIQLKKMVSEGGGTMTMN